MLRGFKRGAIVLLTGLLVLSPLVATIVPASASAASDNPLDQLERWMYYRGMRACLNNPDFNSTIPANDNGTRTASQVNAGQLDIQQKKGFGYLAPSMDDGDDGTVDCMDGSIFVRGATIFGFDNTVELICAMNRALGSGDNDRIEPSNGTDCEQSQEFKFDGGGGDVFQRALTKALESEGSKDRPAFNINDNSSAGNYTHQALLYLIGKNSLETFCGEGAPLSSATGGSIEGDDVVSVDVVTSEGVVKPSQAYAVSNTDRDQDSKVDDIYYNQGGDVNNAQDLRCHEMAKMTRDNSAAYAAWARENKELAEQNDNTSRTSDTTGGGESATTCAIDGIGWIVCPVMTFLAALNDQAFGFLQSLLGIKPSLIQDPATLKAWSTFRDFANVAFVIAFMVIVYSQLTSVGISNYGIKKMLPKIVVAAILVNISYFVCALMVDLSNIVGSSIYTLLSNIAGDAAAEAGTDGNTWSGIVGALLAVGIGVLLIVALILAPTVLLALAVILLILVARQALVLILLIVSPLAFVAYLLPNTESWFKKWWKAFVATLMVYPIIGLVFGASTLASNILMGIAGDGGNGGDDEQMMKIVALAVLAIPLFAVPALLKGSLAATGSIGARISGLADKTQGRAGRRLNDQAKGYVGDAKSRWNMASANGKNGALGALTRRRMQRDFLRSSRESEAKRAEGVYATGLMEGTSEKALKYQRAAGGGVAGGEGAPVRAAAFATQQAHKRFDEDVAAHKTTLSGMSNNELLAHLEAGEGGDEYQAAVAGTLMSRSHRDSHLKALEVVRQRNQAAEATGDVHAQETVSNIQKQMAHDMKDKPWALGDQAAGQLVEGTYGKSAAKSGESQTHFTSSIDQQLNDRVGTKLSAQSLATMNPDEMRRIHSAAMSGNLSDDQLLVLRQKIAEVRSNQQMNALVKPEAQSQFDQILTLPDPPGINTSPNNAATQQEAIDINNRRDAKANRPDEGSLF